MTKYIKNNSAFKNAKLLPHFFFTKDYTFSSVIKVTGITFSLIMKQHQY